MIHIHHLYLRQIRLSRGSTSVSRSISCFVAVDQIDYFKRVTITVAVMHRLQGKALKGPPSTSNKSHPAKRPGSDYVQMHLKIINLLLLLKWDRLVKGYIPCFNMYIESDT